MRITVDLDREEPLNPEEALASIELAGDSGESIQESDVWADDWLMAIMEGAQALSRGEARYAAAILTEPHPLVFRGNGRGLTISYQQSRMTIESQLQFQQELKSVIKGVIEDFGPEQIYDPESFWAKLQQYAGS